MEAVAAVLRLLREGEVHLHLIMLAVARITGELGASTALAGGQELERLLEELAEVLRQARQE
jgi:hypothetical protein